jgi:hypothetical protein
VIEGVEQPSTARAEEAFRERIRAGMANPFNDQEAAKLLEKLNQLELEGKRKAAQNARKRLEERLGGLGVNPEQTADLLAATPSQREQLKNVLTASWSTGRTRHSRDREESLRLRHNQSV